MGDWLHSALDWLVHFVEEMGYWGIFFMTFLESTFVPIPAEFTMLPAGFLVHQGKLNFWLVFLASVVGTIGGAYFNYWIAKRYGRELFIRHGKYFMMTPAKMAKLETFFEKHGALSTFIGRLVPGLKHYISFPAGLAKMRVAPFLAYTTLGGGIWMMILLVLGYKMGENKELVHAYMPWIKAGIFGAVVIGVGVYVLLRKRRQRREQLLNPTDTSGE